MIFLVCRNDGEVLEVVRDESFKESYDAAIGKNNGEFLAKLDKTTIVEIEKVIAEERSDVNTKGDEKK